MEKQTGKVVDEPVPADSPDGISNLQSFYGLRVDKERSESIEEWLQEHPNELQLSDHQ